MRGPQDGNEASFFGYPPHPAPPLMGRVIKRVWDGYEIFFLNLERVWVLPHPAPFTYKINFKIKFNLKFKFKLI